MVFEWVAEVEEFEGVGRGVMVLLRLWEFVEKGGRVTMAAHADRDENIRIISARKTTALARAHYEEKS